MGRRHLDSWGMAPDAHRPSEVDLIDHYCIFIQYAPSGSDCPLPPAPLRAPRRQPGYIARNKGGPGNGSAACMEKPYQPAVGTADVLATSRTPPADRWCAP
jgi:hypothetical protein